MQKKIKMLTWLGWVETEVNLGQLSPMACAIAEKITTTDNGSPHGMLRVRSTLTVAEQVKSHPRYNYDQRGGDSADYVARKNKMVPGWGDRVNVIEWRWDKKRMAESGEHYQERHAQLIINQHGEII